MDRRRATPAPSVWSDSIWRRVSVSRARCEAYALLREHAHDPSRVATGPLRRANLPGHVGAPDDNSQLDPGRAGGSARREYERRRTNREARTRLKHRRLGGLLLALQGAPAHEQSWARGAEGEERVARRLAKLCGDGVILLHDRGIVGRRTNIDHIAVAPSGVWVIDTKRYKGRVRVVQPLLGKAKLTIAGRDKSALADGLAGQVAAVQAAVGGHGFAVRVTGAFCFVDAELPLLGTRTFRGYPLLYPRPLARRIRRRGGLSPEQLAAVATHLATRFPAA